MPMLRSSVYVRGLGQFINKSPSNALVFFSRGENWKYVSVENGDLSASSRFGEGREHRWLIFQ